MGIRRYELRSYISSRPLVTQPFRSVLGSRSATSHVMLLCLDGRRDCAQWVGRRGQPLLPCWSDVLYLRLGESVQSNGQNVTVSVTRSSAFLLSESNAKSENATISDGMSIENCSNFTRLHIYSPVSALWPMYIRVVAIDKLAIVLLGKPSAMALYIYIYIYVSVRGPFWATKVSQSSQC